MPQRFPCNRKIRFTLRFRQPITIAGAVLRSGSRTAVIGAIESTGPGATDRHGAACGPGRAAIVPRDGRGDRISDVGGWAMGRARTFRGRGERGRRRTRQDQISTRTGLATGPGEIAEPVDPHRMRKTCFFCRTGFRKSELS